MVFIQAITQEIIPGKGGGFLSMIAVITTIQAPTDSVRKLAAALSALNCRLIVVGDKKGPGEYNLANVDFYPLSEQLKLPFKLADLLPTGHYGRKNLGYLLAIKQGTECIYETDDDNAPREHWRLRSLCCRAQPVRPHPWFNVYRIFCSELIWPRGFALSHIADNQSYEHDRDRELMDVQGPIQQCLVDGEADVDAIWRLVLDKEVTFRAGNSLVLPAGTWCPFNSQNTWWWPEAYPLMYLPCYCSFRMTDIWRSFIAQRCLWELGKSVVFHGPDAVQDRNVHNLLNDFAEEVPGYLSNEKLVACLNMLELEPGTENIANNMVCCYEALIEWNYFPPKELHLVKCWLKDVETACG